MADEKTTAAQAITQSSRISLALMIIIVSALCGVFIAAFDFKGWVMGEVGAVRAEQIESARALESAVVRMTMQMEQLSTDVGEMKDAVIRQSERSANVQDRLARLETRLDAVEAARDK